MGERETPRKIIRRALRNAGVVGVATTALAFPGDAMANAAPPKHMQSSGINCDPAPAIATPEFSLTKCESGLIRLDSNDQVDPNVVVDKALSAMKERGCIDIGVEAMIPDADGRQRVYHGVKNSDCIYTAPKPLPNGSIGA